MKEFVLDDIDIPGTGFGDDDLNEEQRAVVEAGGGPMLVIAGAGSGKTRALTYRVARLIDRGVPASRILLLTFTNRAATEMAARVDGLVGSAARGTWHGTFHAIARRLLREFGDRLGYPPGFGILDREDSESLMKQCIGSIVEPTAGTRFPRAGVLVQVLSRAANTGRTTRDVFVDEYPRFVEHAVDVERVLVAYQGRKFECGVMDFDDLLLCWRRLLDEHADLREGLTRRFEHVLVDEYQDTNRIQAELVDLMSSGHGNLMVVGDDCQSIYSFRGADHRNIVEFPERHPGTRLFKLETNYRSSPEIVALANASIARNRSRYEKVLRAEAPAGSTPWHVRCTTEDEQAAFVAQRLLQLRDEGVVLDDIAVLYRAHWQSMQLQIELGRRGIPFRVHSGQRFFEQRHVKDALAFLRAANNPRDELAFARVVGLGEGIGARTAARMFAHLRTFDDFKEGLQSDELSAIAGKRGVRAWKAIADVLGRLAGGAFATDAAGALELVVERFYDAYAMAAFDNGQNRVRELTSLAELASRYATLDEFLASAALAGEVSGVDQIEAGERDERVVLSSVHQSKGLEFAAVFVIWLSEDRFPSAQATDDDLEEERRLFYVAVTRAKRELYLTTPVTTFERGAGVIALRDSPFVRELDDPRAPVFERVSLVRRTR
ncbi:MAG: ATP-dependent helicase [Myxococcales bacterium]|nr:ATP-dependent helicase [Myxococcales bacterium]MCB9521157.1 ATP-dependent helicase [Myxococcales bacterium]MCB9530515.1 ATP-dependent helicase [Myxococcales bacterium]